MAIRQDVELRTVQLTPGASITHAPKEEGWGLWVFVIEGEIGVSEDDHLAAGDSLALGGAESIALRALGETSSKVMLFDLPV